MKRQFTKWVKLWVGLMAISFTSYWLLVYIEKKEARNIYDQVKNHDKIFVYQTYFGVVNTVYYVTELRDTTQLIDYYTKLEKKDTSAMMMNMGTEYFPLTEEEPVYVFKYLPRGSKVIEVIDFNTKCWGYIKGYVYRPATHRDAPLPNLVKDFNRYLDSLKNDSYNRSAYPHVAKDNPYGWYCD